MRGSERLGGCLRAGRSVVISLSLVVHLAVVVYLPHIVYLAVVQGVEGASHASLRARVELLLEENRRLRTEITDLKAELAARHRWPEPVPPAAQGMDGGDARCSTKGGATRESIPAPRTTRSRPERTWSSRH
jgi:hypothetical protein